MFLKLSGHGQNSNLGPVISASLAAARHNLPAPKIDETKKAACCWWVKSAAAKCSNGITEIQYELGETPPLHV